MVRSYLLDSVLGTGLGLGFLKASRVKGFLKCECEEPKYATKLTSGFIKFINKKKALN
jgi:hypothetical protein